MNILAIYLLAVANDAPLMLKIIFWILLLLWAVGAFAWRANPNWVIGNSIVAVILFAILGFYVFGF